MVKHSPTSRGRSDSTESWLKNKNSKKGPVEDFIKLRTSDVDKFQALYAERFDKQLDADEARSELALLVRQVAIIYQPVSVHQLERLFTRCREA